MAFLTWLLEITFTMRFASLEFGVDISIFMSYLLMDVSSFDVSLHSLRSEMFIKSVVLKDYSMWQICHAWSAGPPDR